MGTDGLYWMCWQLTYQSWPIFKCIEFFLLFFFFSMIISVFFYVIVSYPSLHTNSFPFKICIRVVTLICHWLNIKINTNLNPYKHQNSYQLRTLFNSIEKYFYFLETHILLPYTTFQYNLCFKNFLEECICISYVDSNLNSKVVVMIREYQTYSWNVYRVSLTIDFQEPSIYHLHFAFSLNICVWQFLFLGKNLFDLLYIYIYFAYQRFWWKFDNDHRRWWF